MSGAGSLHKTGLGRLELSGTSSYSGATSVEAGELKVNGSIADSAVTVASGASLSGSGAVGAISGAGAINPGNSPGILTAPSVDPSGGLAFNFELTKLEPGIFRRHGQRERLVAVDRQHAICRVAERRAMR